MKFLKILTLAFIVPVCISACGGGSNENNDSVLVGPQPMPQPNPVPTPEVTLRYSFTENGCTARQSATGKTHEEAQRKLCEAAADNARNNSCAPMLRMVFIRTNCAAEAQAAEREVAPTPEEEAMLDYRLKNSQFTANWHANAGRKVEAIARKIAYCGLDSRGVRCLDGDFTRGQIFKGTSGMVMRIAHYPSNLNLKLRLKEDRIVILVENHGFFAEQATLPILNTVRVPEIPYDEVELFHRSERALSIAKAAADASGGSSCTTCAEYANVKLDFVRALGYLARTVANAKAEVYQDALIDLALSHRIETKDLAGLADMMHFYKAYGPLAKTLVLEKYPDRVDLLPTVEAYIRSSRPKYSMWAMTVFLKAKNRRQ